MSLRSEKINSDPIEFHYELLEDLGKGTFSVVKRGKHIQTGKEWAIKYIDKSKVLDKMDSIQTEVDILTRITQSRHPHIINLEEIFVTKKGFYLVIEYITGGELFDKIVQLECYSEEYASRIVRQIASAIGHLHSMGVVHRDLKPENLLLSDDSLDAIIKLADFGLSAISAAGSSDEWRLRDAVGTPGYIAPDVLETIDNDHLTYGPEVDLWSLGVIMYILLCGFPPFYSEDEDELYDQIQAGQYTLPSPEWDEISEEAKDLLGHLLVTKPSQRFTASDVLNHPWIAQAPSQHLGATLQQLKKFNAKRKWRGAILAAVTVGKLRKLAFK